MRVKNWEKFQHFKDRRPPWIKLYREILEDPDWHELDGESAKVLVALWLIASEDELMAGNLPDTRRLAFRLRMSEKELLKACSKLSHWVDQSDIKAISGRYRNDAPETETETETETERERETDSAQKRGAGKTAIPENWQVGETSIEYCKREFGLVPEAIERYRVAFVDACKAKDYRYKDFDSAFRNCVRQDWPKFRQGVQIQPLQAKKPDRFELANLEFEKRYGTPESVKALTERLTRVA